jgi:hypothetical protein
MNFIPGYNFTTPYMGDTFLYVLKVYIATKLPGFYKLSFLESSQSLSMKINLILISNTQNTDTA